MKPEARRGNGREAATEGRSIAIYFAVLGLALGLGGPGSALVNQPVMFFLKQRLGLGPQAILRCAPAHAVRAKLNALRPGTTRGSRQLDRVLASRRILRRERATARSTSPATSGPART